MKISLVEGFQNPDRLPSYFVDKDAGQMMDHLIIKDILNSDLAIPTDKGDEVFELVDSLLQKNKYVRLDFGGLTIMTTSFLNAAIGDIYSNNAYSADFLNAHLKLENVKKERKIIVLSVIESAIAYAADKEGFEKIVNDGMYGGY